MYFCSLCASKLWLFRAVTFPSSVHCYVYTHTHWKRRHIPFRFSYFSAMLAFHIVVLSPAASWSWWKTLIQHRSMLNQSSRQRWNVTPVCEVWASEDCKELGGRPITCSLGAVESLGAGIPLRCFHRAKRKSLLQMEMLDYRCRGQGLMEKR